MTMLDWRRRARAAVTDICLAPVDAPPAPPVGARPARFGNGRIEIQIYPGATTQDRLAAARTLLAGTPWRVALDIEEGRDA